MAQTTPPAPLTFWQRLIFLLTGRLENLADYVEQLFDPADTSLRLIRAVRWHGLPVPYFVQDDPTVLRLLGETISVYQRGDVVMGGPGRWLLVFNGQPQPYNFPNRRLDIPLNHDQANPGPLLKLSYSLYFEAAIFDPLRLVAFTGTTNPKRLTQNLLENRLGPQLDQALAEVCAQFENQPLRNGGERLAALLPGVLNLESRGLRFTATRLRVQLQLIPAELAPYEQAFKLLSAEAPSRYELIEEILYGNTAAVVEQAFKLWSRLEQNEPAGKGGFSLYERYRAAYKMGLAADLLFEYVRTQEAAGLPFIQV